jgi:hypothetical protein
MNDDRLGVLKRAEEKGYTTLEAHFLPEMKLDEKGNYPGWDKKPEEWFWRKITEGEVSEDATKLTGQWVLIDGIQKPNYTDGTQTYENDPLKEILELDSRFRLSWDELHSTILPRIAKIFEVKDEAVRLPKEIEFNILGNMHHPEWGETSTFEWLDDKFKSGSRLIGGYSDGGGLSHVSYAPSGNRYAYVGFRPLIVFPT